MMNDEDSSSKSANKAEFDSDLENWLNSTPWVANLNESEMDLCVDDTMMKPQDTIFMASVDDTMMKPQDTIFMASVEDTMMEPQDPSQLLMPVVNACTNLRGGSSNVQDSMQPQFGIPQEMMASNSSTPGSSTGTLHSSGQILSSAIKTLSNHAAQISQSHNTDVYQYQPLQPTQAPQNQPLLQQLFNNKTVQQPQTQLFPNQSNITTSDQMNQLHYQMPSNQLLPCTGPMVDLQTANLHNNQTLTVQMQLNVNKNQLQLQQVTGSSGNLISIEGLQQGDNAQPDLSAPVGFAAPSEFSSSEAYREYAIRQIRHMKERYYIRLLNMHSNAMHLYIQATTMDDSIKYENIKTYLERMLRFLNTSTVDSIPNNDQAVYNYMNTIVNYVNYQTRDKPGGSSLLCEPVHQSPNGSSMQLLNPSQSVTNLEANIVNFNQNLSSRTPLPQESRMPSSLNNKPFQTGVGQNPENPIIIGSLNAPQPTVLTTKQRINLGPYTSSVIASVSHISSSSNTTAAKFQSSAVNHQPPVANKKFSSEKMKQPMHKTNEFTNPKYVRAGKSPLGPNILLNQSPSHKLSRQSSVNPIRHQTLVSPLKFDVNKALSPDSIAKSPFLLSANSSPPSGISSLTMVESQKHITPAVPPRKEPQTSNDALHHLTEVVKSISSKALNCALTEISSMEKVPTNLDGIDQKVNATLDYDNEQHQKMRRSLTVTSVKNDQSGCQEWDTYLTPFNKRAKSEIKWALMEEIKDINAKLIETTIHVVLDLSDDNIYMILGGQKGTILKCYFRNVCFPDLLDPLEGVSSDKMPEFGILLVVPFDFPASSISIFRSGQYVLNELWGKLYEEMLTRFNALIRETRGILCVGDFARKWDASARAVMTEFMEKQGGKSFSSRYGSWESCIKSPSDSK